MSDLENHSGAAHRVDSRIGFFEAEGQRLFAENVLAGGGSGQDRGKVIFGRRCDDDGINAGVLDQLGGVFVSGSDLEFGRNTPRAFDIHIGHGRQSRARHGTAQVRGVAAAHLADANNT